MITLFLDTSNKMAIIAILKDFEIICYKTIENQNNLSEIYLNEIKLAFDEVGLDIKTLKKIYVVNGPGSFTGIRIGLTDAKVIAYSLKCDIVLISELALLATTKTDKKYIVPIIDAKRGYVYGAIYDKNLKPIFEDNYIKYDELIGHLDNKDDAIFVSYDYDNTVLPDIDIIKLIKKFSKKKSINPHKANPNYLKKTEAEEKLKKND